MAKFLQFILVISVGVIIGLTMTAYLDLAPHSTATEDFTPENLNDFETLQKTGRAFVTIAKEVTPAVVNIRTEKVVNLDEQFRDTPFHWFFNFDEKNLPQGEQRSEGMGSGVIISRDGYILTNYHVIRDADVLTIRLSDDREFKAEIVGTDEQSDIAVIKIAGNDLPTVEMGNSDQLEVGEWVVAIGNPFGLNETVTAGIVSALGRNNLNLADYEDFIQTDAAINPGNSGGALVNIYGRLIGINTAIETRTGSFQGVGFAIPINMARQIMDQLIENGKVTRGWLGVGIQDIENETMMEEFGLNEKKGAVFTDVFPDTPAAAANLQQGDVIVEYNGTKIENMQHLRNLVAATPVGEKVDVVVIRDKKEIKATIIIGERPENPNLIARNQTPEPPQEQDDVLGLEVQEINDNLAKTLGLDDNAGVVITRIEPNSPASEAGLQQSDVILEIDRNRILSLRDYISHTSELKADDDILMLIRRAEGTRFMVLKIPAK